MHDIRSKNDIVALIQAQLHRAVSRVERDRLGASNATYFVILDNADEYVVRVAPPNTHDRVAQELWAMRQCQARGIPVPEVIVAAHAQSECPRPWMIMRRLPGSPAFPAPRSRAARDAILEQLGQYLARIHTISLPGWGQLEGRDSAIAGRASSLWEAIQDALAERVAALPTEVLSPHRAEEIRRALKGSKAVFALPSACLVHGDFQFKNVLVGDTRVTGIVDFENLTAGDPVMDFTPIYFWSRQRESDLSAMQRGYGQSPIFDARFSQKLRVYEMLLVLEILWWKVKFARAADITALLARLRTLEAECYI
jgi:aminoglycoside phosphotransferase (APT) family kinase protein